MFYGQMIFKLNGLSYPSIKIANSFFRLNFYTLFQSRVYVEEILIVSIDFMLAVNLDIAFTRSTGK